MIHIIGNYLTRKVWNTIEFKLEWIIEKREHIDSTQWMQLGTTNTLAQARQFIRTHIMATKPL